MKSRSFTNMIMAAACGAALLWGMEVTTEAAPEAVPAETKLASAGTDVQPSEETQVLRNTVFTTPMQMQEMMGNSGGTGVWSVLYLSAVEQQYWNFTTQKEQETHRIPMNVASNAYQNLEMFLDNGYLMDYKELSAYTADYLARKTEMTGSPEEAKADVYYRILTDCLNNPYLLNKPEPVVTDTTYNGRDYSAVFDPDYYYDNNPDLQRIIGFHPPKLLRHFVEKGIMEGRKGNEAFDIDTYIAYADGQTALERSGMQAPGNAPAVAKYSYSRANYYGKLLGHYDYSGLFATENSADW